MILFFFLLAHLASLLPDIALFLVLFRLLLSYRSILFLLTQFWHWVVDLTQVYQLFIIPKLDPNSQVNPLYRKALSYLSTLPSLEDSDHSSLFSSPIRTNHYTFHLVPGQKAEDFFKGVRITWTRPSEGEEHLEIRMRQQDRAKTLRPYLRHIESEVDRREQRQRNLQLFNAGETETMWVPITVTHICDFSGFKMIAMSYLGLSEHPLFESVEEEINLGAKVTLSQVVEMIIEHRRRPQQALRAVINAMQESRRNGEGEREREVAREGEREEARGIGNRRIEKVKRFVRRFSRVVMMQRRNGEDRPVHS